MGKPKGAESVGNVKGTSAKRRSKRKSEASLEKRPPKKHAAPVTARKGKSKKVFSIFRYCVTIVAMH
jgi:hypothetical protein